MFSQNYWKTREKTTKNDNCEIAFENCDHCGAKNQKNNIFCFNKQMFINDESDDSNSNSDNNNKIEEKKEKPVYHCHLCNHKPFNLQYALKRHVVEFHNQGIFFRCLFFLLFFFFQAHCSFFLSVI